MVKSTAGIITAGALLLSGFVAVPAYADTANKDNAVKVRVNQNNNLSQVINRSDMEITRRIDTLNKLNARVQAMKNVSDVQKASVSSEVSAEVANLTALKTKIDADTDLTVARNDEKSIFAPIRIYALVVPQYNILVSADRITTVSGLLSTISGKLETRITAAQSAGKNVSAMQTALTDMKTKIADAQSQANAAKNGVLSLKPDNGDKTIATSNKAALISARATIKAGTTDLKTARGNAQTIIKSLKTVGQ